MLRVYEALREQILDGSLPQGAPVSIQAISAEMQSSNGPVISALTRLSHEGLVQHRRGAGYHVARWTPEMLEGLLTVRRALETEAARLAARRAGPEDLQQLAAHIARMGELVCERRRAAADAADVEFHIAVAQLSRCPALIDALKRSHLLEIVRRRLLMHEPRGDFDNLAINHQVLLDAIASGDPDRAGRAMHLHLSGPIPLHWPTASE
jgi:DNA-binding GntR family transcriptional regulator